MGGLASHRCIGNINRNVETSETHHGRITKTIKARISLETPIGHNGATTTIRLKTSAKFRTIPRLGRRARKRNVAKIAKAGENVGENGGELLKAVDLIHANRIT
jgi:hypothetical protein